MMQLRHRPTQEYKEKYGNLLSEERKQILLPAAVDLIYSTGVSAEELQQETNGDTNEILKKAFKIYSITN